MALVLETLLDNAGDEVSTELSKSLPMWECEISTVSVSDWDPLALGDDVAAAATGLKPAFLLVCLTMCDFRKENVLATHCCLSVSSVGPWPDRERVSLPYMVSVTVPTSSHP